MLALGVSDSDRTLLPDGRLAGPMPWVIAIMTLLTVLAAAGGLALGHATGGVARQLSGRATVQVVEANPDVRAAQTRAALAQLARLSAVRSARQVDEAQLRALLRPWLGDAGLSADLPIPTMIDVTLASADARDLADVRAALARVAPAARVEPHAQWLGPLQALLATLRWLALAIVLLVGCAMMAAVAMAVRAGLNTHRATIDIMHLMGASDAQVARLFQRRAGLDAAFGATVGFLGGLIAALFVAGRLNAVRAALVDQGGLHGLDYAVVVAIPFAAVVLAVVAARLTVLRVLARKL